MNRFLIWLLRLSCDIVCLRNFIQLLENEILDNQFFYLPSKRFMILGKIKELKIKIVPVIISFYK